MRRIRVLSWWLASLSLASLGFAQQPGPAIMQPDAVPHVVLKVDTPVQLKLAQNLSNKTDTVGSKIELVLDQDLSAEGNVVARKGARALGRITEGKADEGPRQGKSLRFELLYLKAGPVKVPLSGQLSGEGHRDAGTVVAATVLLGVTGLIAALNSPKNFVIPEGTPLTGFVAQDTDIPLPDGTPPQDVSHP